MTNTTYRCEPQEGELYLPDTVVPAGLYGLVGTNIRIRLKQAGCLPAAPDGRTACYEALATNTAGASVWRSRLSVPAVSTIRPLADDAEPR